MNVRIKYFERYVNELGAKIELPIGKAYSTDAEEFSIKSVKSIRYSFCDSKLI